MDWFCWWGEVPTGRVGCHEGSLSSLIGRLNTYSFFKRTSNYVSCVSNYKQNYARCTHILSILHYLTHYPKSSRLPSSIFRIPGEGRGGSRNTVMNYWLGDWVKIFLFFFFICRCFKMVREFNLIFFFFLGIYQL